MAVLNDRITQLKFLSSGELSLLVDVLRRRSGINARDVLMLELLVMTGPRASELLALRFEDLNSSNRTVFYRGTKGSRDREVPVSEDLFSRLMVYGLGRDRLFQLSYNGLRKVWFKHRPVKKKLHSLRHTFAMELYKRSGDVRLVQRALGHRYLSTTLIYSEYAYSLDEMRKFLGNY